MILLLPQNQNNGKMSRKILIINGHPDKESLNHALAASYKEGAIQAGAEVQEIAIAELEFSPNWLLATASVLNLSLIFWTLGIKLNGLIIWYGYTPFGGEDYLP